MSLLCEELSYELEGKHQHTIETLNTQISRCKEALATLSASTGSAPLTGGKLLPINVFLDNLLTEWKMTHPNTLIETHWDGLSPTPSILADRTLQQALINVLDNADEASPNKVSWLASWDSNMLTINIKDRGTGLSSEAKQAVGSHPFTAKTEGLGLGLFLTHSVIRRFGGNVQLFNRQHGGVSTVVNLPIISHDTPKI